MRILLVEDNQDNIEAAKRQLAGHDLTIASGFDQALEALENSSLCWASGYESKSQEELKKEIKSKMEKEVMEIHGAELTGLSFRWNGYKAKPVFIDSEWNEVTDIPATILESIEGIASRYRKPFDVVLTDVMFTKGGTRCLGAGVDYAIIKAEMPYGPMVALHAIAKGVKRIGILTDSDHHSDPFAFAVEGMNSFTTGEAKIVCSSMMKTFAVKETMENYKVPSFNDTEYSTFDRRRSAGEIVHVKDWARLLEEVTAE